MTTATPDRNDMPDSSGMTPEQQKANEFREFQITSQRIISEFTTDQRLTAQQINVEAARESVRRLKALAAQSASELTPNPTVHATIDRMLDQRYDNIVTQAQMDATHTLTASGHPLETL